FGNGAGFFFAIPIGSDLYGIAFIVIRFRPERFAKALFIRGDDAGGGTENIGGGAVVPLQADDLRAGKIFFKAENVIHLRAAPAIDGLVIITHAADIFMLLRQQAQPEILRDIGVLIFVHQHIFKTVLPLGEYLGVALKN